MSRDEIMALVNQTAGHHWMDEAHIQRFAALVAAAEREACAKVCEETDLVEYQHCMVLHIDGHATLKNAAAAIRARNQQ